MPFFILSIWLVSNLYHVQRIILAEKGERLRMVAGWRSDNLVDLRDEAGRQTLARHPIYDCGPGAVHRLT
jgi:hypothetical protein